MESVPNESEFPPIDIGYYQGYRFQSLQTINQEGASKDADVSGPDKRHAQHLKTQGERFCF